jgi:hypothetical protein
MLKTFAPWVVNSHQIEAGIELFVMNPEEAIREEPGLLTGEPAAVCSRQLPSIS